MKKLLVLLSCLILGCRDPVTKIVSVDSNSTVEINGKNCQVFKVSRGSDMAPLFYIDCPTGTSTTYNGGKSGTYSTSTNLPKPTEIVPAPLIEAPSICHCK